VKQPGCKILQLTGLSVRGWRLVKMYYMAFQLRSVKKTTSLPRRGCYEPDRDGDRRRYSLTRCLPDDQCVNGIGSFYAGTKSA